MTISLLAPEDVEAIVEQVWSSLLEVEPAFGPLPDVDASAGETWTATVTVSGPVAMLIATAMPREAAVDVASRLLMVDDPTTEDVADALGELVNVLGGNLKSMLPGPSTLSLPVTVTGEVAPPSHAEEQGRCVAVLDGRPISLTTYLLDPGAVS
ncbi:chemotaxis protein CheX [Nocardioides mangrovicus]|uniref:Chemotaxis protein CheX n=1 Tax=Nocardioides mangrovicus TaxID=2478913 RepID=A0A3L8P027_9ACTN|nr:chemotaxis protein CheX [Nocardioides mangrovicus]RLV48786.1 chemotaxis protein CheX [Nocardioides mangrovicus]